MEASNIYKKAIKRLFHNTYGKMEHDENKAIELFDKLLDRNITIRPADLKEICRGAGYDEFASEDISKMYDYVNTYKQYKKGTIISCWTTEMIDELCKE